MVHNKDNKPTLLFVDHQRIHEAAMFCATHTMCNGQCPIYKTLLEQGIAVTPDKCRDEFVAYIAYIRATEQSFTIDVTACAEAVQEHCQSHTCLYCDFRTTKEVTIDNKKVQVLDCKLHADIPEEWRLEDEQVQI